MSSYCFEKKRRCYNMVNMPSSQLFWDLWQASNFKWAHFVYKILKCLSLNISVIYVQLWIKYWLMWFESHLGILLFKQKHLVNNCLIVWIAQMFIGFLKYVVTHSYPPSKVLSYNNPLQLVNFVSSFGGNVQHKPGLMLSPHIADNKPNQFTFITLGLKMTTSQCLGMCNRLV